MGILDDAIREHLELKRQHGAESDDLERLENEAFGAPARPGDPEFATGEEPAVAEAPAVEPEGPPAEPEAPGETPGSTDDWLAAADETTVVPAEPAAPEAEDPASSAEQARAEHPHLDDTADHPAPEAEAAEAEAPAFDEPAPPAEEPVAGEQPALAPSPEPEPEPPPPAMEEPLPPAGETEPPEAPERGIFDAGDEFDFDDDLDLELDEEDDGTVGPQSADAPPAADDATEVQPAAPYVEDDTDNPPLPIQPKKPEGDEGEENGEDLLEGTPDFLQEQPEGEDLWFEQGPPKDFDFDDD
jgi:hypothetical protein